jgi:hypothetical protein
MDHDAAVPELDVSGLVVARVGSVEASTAATLPWVVLDGAADRTCQRVPSGTAGLRQHRGVLPLLRL